MESKRLALVKIGRTKKECRITAASVTRDSNSTTGLNECRRLRATSQSLNEARALHPLYVRRHPSDIAVSLVFMFKPSVKRQAHRLTAPNLSNPTWALPSGTPEAHLARLGVDDPGAIRGGCKGNPIRRECQRGASRAGMRGEHSAEFPEAPHTCHPEAPPLGRLTPSGSWSRSLSARSKGSPTGPQRPRDRRGCRLGSDPARRRCIQVRVQHGRQETTATL